MIKDEECYFMVNGNGYDIELDNFEILFDVGSMYFVEWWVSINMFVII